MAEWFGASPPEFRRAECFGCRNNDRLTTDVWKLKKFRRPAAILMPAVGALATYLLRGGFYQFDITPYPVPPAAFTNWSDVLAHSRDISLTTFQTGVVHMDACRNLDPSKPQASRMRSCAARSRRAGSLSTPSPLRRLPDRHRLRRYLRETSAVWQLHRGDAVVQLVRALGGTVGTVTVRSSASRKRAALSRRAGHASARRDLTHA